MSESNQQAENAVDDAEGDVLKDDSAGVYCEEVDFPGLFTPPVLRVDAQSRSRSSCDSREERYYAADAVLEPVGEHSGTQSFAPICKHSQKRSLDHDSYHCLAVEAMSETEDSPL